MCRNGNLPIPVYAMLYSSRRKKLVVHEYALQDSSTVWMTAFLKYLADELQLADNTLAAYERDMKRFFRWLGNRRLQTLNVNILADYVDELRRQKLAPPSIARHIASLRVFLRYLQLEGVLADNPAELLGSQKLWERVPHILSPGQVNAMLTAPEEQYDRLWRRDRAILEFFYATGCRVSELVNMKLPDIHFDEGYCMAAGKGNKQRLVPLNKQAITAFDEWMKTERPVVENRAGSCLPWAFLSYKGRKMRREAMWEFIKKYAVRIGASAAVTPHTMRHSFATHLLIGGADLRLVQEMLGHATIATTQIYTHVDMSKLKSIHQKFHPRG